MKGGLPPGNTMGESEAIGKPAKSPPVLVLNKPKSLNAVPRNLHEAVAAAGFTQAQIAR